MQRLPSERANTAKRQDQSINHVAVTSWDETNVPDSRVANHKRQNTGFRSANQVEVDLFSAVPETVSLPEPPTPPLLTRSAPGSGGFSWGELMKLSYQSVLIIVCSLSEVDAHPSSWISVSGFVFPRFHTEPLRAGCRFPFVVTD